MPFPCADCDLNNAGTCRITDIVRGPADECTLTLAQQGSLFTQSKRLIASGSSALELEIGTVTPCSGGAHIGISGTLDESPFSVTFEIPAVIAELAEMGVRGRVLGALFEALRMVGATNGSQAKTILEGTVWYV